MRIKHLLTPSKIITLLIALSGLPFLQAANPRTYLELAPSASYDFQQNTAPTFKFSVNRALDQYLDISMWSRLHQLGPLDKTQKAGYRGSWGLAFNSHREFSSIDLGLGFGLGELAVADLHLAAGNARVFAAKLMTNGLRIGAEVDSLLAFDKIDQKKIYTISPSLTIGYTF